MFSPFLQIWKSPHQIGNCNNTTLDLPHFYSFLFFLSCYMKSALAFSSELHVFLAPYKCMSNCYSISHTTPLLCHRSILLSPRFVCVVALKAHVAVKIPYMIFSNPQIHESMSTIWCLDRYGGFSNFFFFYLEMKDFLFL